MLPKSKRPFRILSCHGGGARGVIPSLVLLRIEQITGKHPSELFDLMIGTSTGALVCTVLNVPNVPSKLEMLSKDISKDIESSDIGDPSNSKTEKSTESTNGSQTHKNLTFIFERTSSA